MSRELHILLVYLQFFIEYFFILSEYVIIAIKALNFSEFFRNSLYVYKLSKDILSVLFT
jgi:hypothetical protein